MGGNAGNAVGNALGNAGGQKQVCYGEPIEGSEPDWWKCDHQNMHTCGNMCCCDDGYQYDVNADECLPCPGSQPPPPPPAPPPPRPRPRRPPSTTTTTTKA